MHNLPRALAVVACGAAVVACSMLVATGCGSQSHGTTPSPDGGGDGTVDAAPDAVVGADADASDATSDAGGDATSEDATGISDASDFADIGDVQIDVPAITDFPEALTIAYCTRLQQCCLVPDGQWNQTGPNGCVPLFEKFGGAFHVAAYGAALDSGLVAYDASTAYQCLAHMLAFNCGTLQVSGEIAEERECYAALQGTLAVNAGPCINSLECQTGEYCRLGDASSGTCAALGGVGAPCSDLVYSTDCTYLGTGVPAEYCAPTDAGTGTCQNALPLDAGCNLNQWCQSGSCDNYCSNQYVFSDPGVPNGTCAAFTIPDAGGD